MFIRRLVIQNFRCFENLEIDFFDNENKVIRSRSLILGENGTGKSTILKAIALTTAGSDALGEILGKPDDWIKNDKDFCRIDLMMNTQKGEERNIYLEIRRKDSLSDVIKRCDESFRQLEDAIEHTDRNYFVVGYGASRIMSVSSSFNNNRRMGMGRGYSSQRAQCIASLLDKTFSLNSIQDWAIDLDYRKEEGGLKEVEKVFEILDGIKFHKLDRESYKLLVKTDDGIVGIDGLSDGFQNMVSWIGDLLYRVTNIFKDHTNPLKARGVLLIDEIDLHLHPAWQRKLLDFIQKTLPNMQLIASTHSPFVAQQAGNGELFIIERDDNKSLRIDQFPGNPQKLLLHQIVLSDVFGLKTDESVDLEKRRNSYEDLKSKMDRSFNEENKFMELKSQLDIMPMVDYKNNEISNKELEASLNVLKMYKNKRKDD